MEVEEKLVGCAGVWRVLRELFAPYGIKEYKGLVEEWIEREERMKKDGKVLQD